MASRNPGWKVTFAGLGINLALGVLYAWSVIAKGIPDSWGWSEADKSWPYSICCLIFCLVMVPAGRLQDRYGPRLVATVGGVLVGLGLIFASFFESPFGYGFGFGVLAGAGIGFGYAAATPPAIKWFASAKTGMIAGLVVSGFGLASVYIAPLARGLIDSQGVPTTVFAFGIGFLLIVTTLARYLKPPPANYIAPGEKPHEALAADANSFRPGEMVSTWQFYALWFMYACGAGAGLMVIAKLATIASVQGGIQLGFLLVVALALGNGAGRILAGMHSDRIGRKWTFIGVSLTQAAMVVALSQVEQGSWLANTAVLGVIAAAIGANYGANLALFPSITKDFYGSKHFGINYGMIFTAWGVGGFMLAILAGEVYDRTNSFNFAYLCSIGLLIVAAGVTLFVNPPKRPQRDDPLLVSDSVPVGSV
ncbi:MAG: L-lactate MFS transporter [Planctomycetota bacterium]|jgi:OFA family oxalate/formate antiporter-like MFS transporter